ncbi:MAG: PAS domain S-box protein [Candidatus Acidiferrales bacterium]
MASTTAVYLSAMADAAQSATPDTQLFRNVFNASPIGIAVENLEGQPLFINPAFCSMLGFSEDELRGKHCVDFSPAEDAEKDWALFQQLRAGAIDHYQLEKRYFRRDGSLVWGSLSISLLNSRPSPLVIAMVEDITDKKNAEEARSKLAAVVESSDDAIASGTLDGIIVGWNTGAQKIYGYTEAEALGKPINMLVPPELTDEENKLLEMLRGGRPIQNFETVRVTKTGTRINVSLTISPIKDSSGRTVGCSAIARDITKRKLAEAALANVSRQLIEAQEQERSRIGRELHDDIVQRLVLLALQLQQLHQGAAISPEVRSRMGEFQNQITEIANDIQSLSHELHSSKLQYLGIAAAMRSFCREFAEQQKVEIDFTAHDLPSSLSSDISLCLFRVLQEALHNSAKHSGVRQFEVRLWGTSDEIQLTVKDFGAGFDREAANKSRGVGLISMEERLKLVKGTLSIISQPEKGTTVHGSVPLRSANAMHSAG